MDHATLALVLGVPAAFAVGLWAWRTYHPLSFWYLVGFPIKAVRLYLTWDDVAAGCKLTRRRRAWRYTLTAVPLIGAVSRSTETVFQEKRRLRRVEVERAARLGLIRPTSIGWKLPVRLHDGQIPSDYAAVAERLAHAWRVHGVRVLETKPGRLVPLATGSDPLTHVEPVTATEELLVVRPGMLENGNPWVIDFKMIPIGHCRPINGSSTPIYGGVEADLSQMIGSSLALKCRSSGDVRVMR
jgi:S-DNA-T family DNA segregation ATPase FtsK/SpoIIIE